MNCHHLVLSARETECEKFPTEFHNTEYKHVCEISSLPLFTLVI